MTQLREIPIRTIDGRATTLAEFEGDVLLLVNVASECGFTPQYAALEALHRMYRDRGFAVLGFPSNDFGRQEPGTHAEIAEFCAQNYRVTFPLFEKIEIAGANKHPLYRELIALAPAATGNGDGLRSGLAAFASSHGLPAPSETPEVLWNFEKFLVGREGEVLERFASDVTPDDPRVTGAVEKALEEKA